MKGLDRAVIMSKRTIYAYWPYMAKEGRGYTPLGNLRREVWRLGKSAVS